MCLVILVSRLQHKAWHPMGLRSIYRNGPTCPRPCLPGKGRQGHALNRWHRPPAPGGCTVGITEGPVADLALCFPTTLSRQLTVLWKGCSRVVSSSPGGPPKGFRAEPGSYMEKAWRSLRWAPGPMGVCSARSLGSGGVGTGPGGCRICKFSACSLWI